LKKDIYLTGLYIFLVILWNKLIISLRLLSFGRNQIRISDPRSCGSWCFKGTDESTLDKDPSVLLKFHDPSDLGTLILIWIIPKKHTLKPCISSCGTITKMGLNGCVTCLFILYNPGNFYANTKTTLERALTLSLPESVMETLR